MSRKNPDLQEILEGIKNGENQLLHGPGGVGKSYTIKKICQEIGSEKVINVCATTGVAAYLLCDPEHGLIAKTLHSFAGIYKAEGPISEIVKKAYSNKKSSNRWKACELLVIDECSMAGCRLLKVVDAVARTIRGIDKPMGGIQVIFSGDFLQLPPVKDEWLFKSDIYQRMNVKIYTFEKAYRYEDEDFFELLLRIRKGKHTSDDLKTIRKRVKANEKMQDRLDELIKEDPRNVIRPTMMFSKRVDVDAYNNRELSRLKTEEQYFVATDELKRLKGNPKMEDYSKLMDEQIPRDLILKEGAQVMLKVNLSVEEGLVNGSRGVVNEIIGNEAVMVKFLNGKNIRIDRGTFTLRDKYGELSRNQIPLVLAYSLTIHKSQGSNLDYLVCDLGGSVFCEGAAYTALSRCRKLKGLFITEFLPASIMVSQEALGYVEGRYIHEFDDDTLPSDSDDDTETIDEILRMKSKDKPPSYLE